MNLKARYGYIFFYCFLNYLFAFIKVKLVYKIPIVAIPELKKSISDQVTILSCASGYIANSGNVKYICFNLPELSSIASSTNSDCCYLPMTTKISNFLYGVQYMLFEIILGKIISQIKLERLPLCLSSSVSNSFDLQY